MAARSPPERVNVHDFPNRAMGKAIPYGVYDLARNTAWVAVGQDHDTASFAVATIMKLKTASPGAAAIAMGVEASTCIFLSQSAPWSSTIPPKNSWLISP